MGSSPTSPGRVALATSLTSTHESTMLLLAQDATGSLFSLWPLLLVAAVFWFLVIRPQRKRQQEREDMLSRLAVGSEVVTIGGLFGEVEALDESWVDLLVGQDVVLRFSRSAIGRIATDDDRRSLEAFASGESTRDGEVDWPGEVAAPEPDTERRDG